MANKDVKLSKVGLTPSRLYGIEVPLMLMERLVTEQAYLLRYLIIFLTMR